MSGKGEKSSKEVFMYKSAELIKNIKTAMLTTRHGDDLYSRPMVIQDREFDGSLYFLTSMRTGKCDDLKVHPKVNLAFANPSTNSFVSLSGHAELLDDRDLIKELWHTFDTTFLSGDKDDPDLRIIKVCAESVEYWDSPSSSVVLAYRKAKTALTGDLGTMGDNERQVIKPSGESNSAQPAPVAY